ncbi:MAG: hypothetical protein HY613_04360 [Candidatus Rokubacteria bacterium]|nr:hypothetical protein [Candidatus Rokubacteria bacterium]
MRRRTLRRWQYPQVEAGARALARAAVAVCPSRTTVVQALRLLQRRRAPLLVVHAHGRVGVVRPEDLRRARTFGLGRRSVADVAVWTVSTVSAEASEASVRRLLLSGAPAVLVRERGGVVGAVEPFRRASGTASGGGALSLAGRLERQLPGETLGLLRLVGRLAESCGMRVCVAGGFVRDLLRGAPTQDVDLVVEGDGLPLARQLCRELGGSLVVHPAFGTASIEGWTGGRVDLATARRERYAAPGALPGVTPAHIEEDLARRDFTVNAMALTLNPDAFGSLLDPFGGQRDLRTRRIRILHPLSFVEDPTRIFRGARYAVRLGLIFERWTRRSLSVALDLGPYPALSGQRLLAEVELIVSEPGWERALGTLGRLGAFRLLEPSYRFARQASRRLGDLTELLRWARERSVGLDPVPLVLLCLVGHLSASLAERCLRRLALSGEPLARLLAALVEGPAVSGRLGAGAALPASRLAAALRDRSSEALGYAWLVGSPSTRQQIRWFLDEGRGVRPLLSGEDLLGLGVAKGPVVSELLHRLRDRRLDGQVSSRDEELRLVREWMTPSQTP